MTDANGIYSNVNERTQTALTTLRAILDRLAHTSTPKTIVYISEGLVLERPSDGTSLGAAGRARAGDDLRAPTRGVRARMRRRRASVDLLGATRRWRSKDLGIISGVTRGTVFPGRRQRRWRFFASGARALRVTTSSASSPNLAIVTASAQDQSRSAAPELASTCERAQSVLDRSAGREDRGCRPQRDTASADAGQ